MGQIATKQNKTKLDTCETRHVRVARAGGLGARTENGGCWKSRVIIGLWRGLLDQVASKGLQRHEVRVRERMIRQEYSV